MFMDQLSFWDCRLYFLTLSSKHTWIPQFLTCFCFLISFLLALLQIDAAINSGNSGGPAFNDKGTCVGIAFQSLKHEDAENIGYVIPTPVINHFITDYEKNGSYTGLLVS